jgi:hypothetical protein
MQLSTVSFQLSIGRLSTLNETINGQQFKSMVIAAAAAVELERP